MHAHELTDLDLHFAPVLVKLLLELSGLLEVALQLTPGDDEPEGNEHNDAAQHDGVDQPCQHCVEEPASIADGSLIANAGAEAICSPSNSGLSEQSQCNSESTTALMYTFTESTRRYNSALKDLSMLSVYGLANKHPVCCSTAATGQSC